MVFKIYLRLILMSFTALILHVCLLGQNQLGEIIEGNSEQAYWGTNIKISGDGKTLVFAAPNFSLPGNGEIRVYDFIGNEWVYRNNITAIDYDNKIGIAVDISNNGNRIVTGNYLSGGNSSIDGHGAVRVFEWENDEWNQIGNTIIGDFDDDQIGRFVTISKEGNRIATRSKRNDNGELLSQVNIYEFQNVDWVPLGDAINFDFFNSSFDGQLDFAMQGNILAIGNENNKTRIFQFQSGEWVPKGNDISSNELSSLDGYALSLSDDGNYITIGDYEQTFSTPNDGIVLTFKFVDEEWTQVGNILFGITALDWFGISVDISSSGQTIAVGAREYLNENGYTQIYTFLNNEWELKYTIDGEFGNSGDFISLNHDASIIAIAAPFSNSTFFDGGSTTVFELEGEVTTIRNIESQNIISFYPNPTNGIVRFNNLENRQISISVFDYMGKKVMSKRIFQNQISLNDLKTGIYSIKIMFEDEVIIKKVIKI